VDLQRRRLLLWIQAHDAAKMLINTRTGQRIPKENVLDTGFYKMPNFIEPQGTGYYGGDTMGGCGGNGGGGGGNMMNAGGIVAGMGGRGGDLADVFNGGVGGGQQMFG